MKGRIFLNVRLKALLAVVAIGITACGTAELPEQQVRAVLEAAESAVEARDVSAVLDLVSSDYADSDGRKREELGRFLRGYFIANQSIRLLTRIESLEFPAADVAEVTMQVGMVGREAEADSAWNLAADLYRIDLTLMRDGGDWLITHARGERLGPALGR